MIADFSLKDKVAVVTGGGRGIGKGIALALAEAGADVVVAGRTEEPLRDTAREIAALGRRSLPVVMDVGVPEQVEKMVSRTVAEMGRIDILVSNAGTNRIKPIVPLPGMKYQSADTLPAHFFEPVSDSEWSEMLGTNLFGPFYCIRAVGPHMLNQKQGKIVIVSSIAAFLGRAYEVPYSASKGGLAALTRSLAREWGRFNINVNSIAPGLTITDMTQRIMEDKTLMERRLQRIPLKRLGQPRDIALTAVFLASPASNHVTGQVIAVDGGESV
ncbi:MAG: glucose 1-dehydrogenase [Chloroflexota bacterium]